MSDALDLGFVPLLDAAPLILAQQVSFPAEERLTLRLHPARSWSKLRDILSFGQVDAAQMLSAIPIAARLRLGGTAVDLEAALVLSLGGQVIGVSTALADEMRQHGHRKDFTDAKSARKAIRRARPDGLKFGVPFPFSMHSELLHVWLDGRVAVTTVTVPPARLTDALISGDIGAFCVGEPWGSQAVDHDVAELILPGTAIWSAAPAKVLAMRSGWAEANPELAGRLLRTIWRTCRWLSQAESRTTASDLLGRSNALNIDPEVIDRGISGHLLLRRNGISVATPGFVNFHKGTANFPWRSQAAWIGWHLARRHGVDPAAAAQAAESVWRPRSVPATSGRGCCAARRIGQGRGREPCPGRGGRESRHADFGPERVFRWPHF